MNQDHVQKAHKFMIEAWKKLQKAALEYESVDSKVIDLQNAAFDYVRMSEVYEETVKEFRKHRVPGDLVEINREQSAG